MRKIKIVLYLITVAAIVFCVYRVTAKHANAQSGTLTSNLSGNGTPTSNGWPCGTGYLNQIYIQNDATNGHIWLCDASTGSPAWDHLLIGTTTMNSSGGSLIENCMDTPVTSTVSGTWSSSYTSVGSTVVFVNAQAISSSAALGGVQDAKVVSATTTAASGSVTTNAVISVLGVNVTVPILSTTPTTIYLRVCAT